MPRFEFRDEDTGFNYVTYTPNLDIAIRNAKINGFREDQLVQHTLTAPLLQAGIEQFLRDKEK